MKFIRSIFTISSVVAATIVCASCSPSQPDDPNLSKISVTTKPFKTTYTVGQKFNPAGMVITAKYIDGSMKTVNDYLYEPSGKLKLSDTKITISYYGKSTTTPITVSETGGGDEEYYAEIDPDSNTLLNDLNSLNSKKRESSS